MEIRYSFTTIGEIGEISTAYFSCSFTHQVCYDLKMNEKINFWTVEKDDWTRLNERVLTSPE